MKKAMIVGAVVVAAVLVAAQARAGDIVVQALHGDVSVRHGVTEVWTRVAVGDVLRPDDTMKTGKKGSAVIQVPLSEAGGAAARKVVLPAEVIVDMSDVRDLTQEELMLKLTMEKVRASSYQWKSDELQIPNADVVHGADRSSSQALSASDPATGVLELNGARVLYDNGFFATCALKGMEVLRIYPPLGKEFHNRLLVAEALEKAHLRGEALNEYGAIARLDGITPDQETLVHNRIAALRK